MGMEEFPLVGLFDEWKSLVSIFNPSRLSNDAEPLREGGAKAA